MRTLAPHEKLLKLRDIHHAIKTHSTWSESLREIQLGAIEREMALVGEELKPRALTVGKEK